MQRLRHISRICLVLAMIPLTVFSGRMAAGCVCADGHFELLCRGGATCSGPGKGQPSASCGCTSGSCTTGCCHAKGRLASDSQASEGPAGQVRSNDCQKGCCHPLTLSSMTVDKQVSHQLDLDALALDCVILEDLLPAVVEQTFSVPPVDTRPPIERLHFLQRLLI